MYIQQLYTNCLSQAAYYIENNGEAAIIDPLRDIDQYMDILSMRKTKLKYIFETHFHADFVSGHIDLAEKTGATIVFGPNANPGYTAYIAKNHEKMKIGNCTIEVLHTPGHTIESSCFLLHDKSNYPHALFSGDTVFVGDVGRPDLLSGNLPKETLASMLYDSINNEILPLNDDVILYPGHGAGSPCGRSLGKETFSTIGSQKKFNYALQPMSREDFIHEVTTDQPLPPKYFFSDSVINKTGYEPIGKILKKEIRLLTPEEIDQEIRGGTLILDVRTAEEFAHRFVEGSINIGLNGTYAIWAGTILPVITPLILIAPQGKATEAITRLTRVGFENIVGYWDQPLNKLAKVIFSYDRIPCIEPRELLWRHREEKIILDVRNVNEFREGHIKNSLNIPLNVLNDRYAELDKYKRYYLVCAGGYRSMIACSLLASKGFTDITNVDGGIAEARQRIPDLITSPEHIL